VRPAMAIFILFFGVALIEALRGGQWSQVAFWVAIALLFFVLERRGMTSGR
jgi:hypothetical protein